MSTVSLFTAVKYKNNLENPLAKGWCAKQLDQWTFPIFGSKVEVIRFKDKVARYQEDTTKSTFFGVAVRILLFISVIFPLIVLMKRAVIRHNITFKKVEFSSTVLVEGDEGIRMRVPLNKLFSIELWHSSSTGYSPWNILQIPSFIHRSDQYIKSQNHPPGFCGGGSHYVFDFEPTQAGTGDIVMQHCHISGQASLAVEKKFTIIADPMLT